jgi:dTMP kinase
MVACDIGRGLVLATLPWVDTIPGLVFASLLLEILTLLWSPAKEASVPKLVPAHYLPTANSLSLVAAYGTFPVGSAVFAALAGVAKFLGGYEALRGLSVDQEFVAIYFDVFTFFISAILISTLVLPHVRRVPSPDETTVGGIPFGSALRDMREGLSVIARTRLIRSVMLAIATGLIGGGMLVPLGPRFAKETLGGGSAAFGLLLTALGGGMAAGIVGLSVLQRKLPHQRVFVWSVLGAGFSILTGASMSNLPTALLFVTLLGVFAGAIYVLGFTILQSNVEDEVRGRIFAVLNTLVRFCLLLAFAIAPFLSSLLDSISVRLVDRHVDVLGIGISVPGTRLTLWLGGLIILAAGVLAKVSMRAPSTPSAEE